MIDDDGSSGRAAPAPAFSEPPSADPERSPTRLRALLAHSEWRVRKAAAQRVASHLGEPEIVEMLVEALLAADDVGLRNAAIEAFSLASERDAPRVAAALVGALEHAAPAACKFIAAALVGGGEHGVAALLGLARDADAMTATAAVEALAELARRGLRSDRIRETLEQAVGHAEPLVRLAALEGLEAMSVAVPSSHLRDALNDPLTRSAALAVLAHGRDVDGLALMFRFLQRGGELRHAAAALLRRARAARANADEIPVWTGALGRLDDDAVEALAAALREGAPEDARALARLALDAGALRLLPAIAELGARVELDPETRAALFELGPRALEPLEAVVHERSLDAPEVARWALEAAIEIASVFGSQDARSRLEHLAVEFQPTVGDVVLPSEPQLPHDSLDPAALRDHLTDEDPERRRAALDLAASVDDVDAFEVVVLACTDEDEAVRVAALRAIRRVRAPERVGQGIAVGLAALDDAAGAVRTEAMQTLSSLDPSLDRVPVQTLVRSLADPDPRVVLATLRALGSAAATVRADDELAGALERLLWRADPAIAREALFPLDTHAVASDESRVIEALGHPHWSVRLRAAELLARTTSLSRRARAAVEARRACEEHDLVRDALASFPSGGAP